MAITRAQQAKQMLQDGGMLVQPGFGGTRQGYRSAKAQERRTGGAQRTGKRPSSPSQRPGASDSRSDEVTVTPAQRDKFKADRKTFARNLKPESGLSKIIRGGGLIPTFLSGLTDSEFNKKRRANFMRDLTDLSKRFQTRRNINLPFGIGSFDANARINNNLLQNLLNEAQEEFNITPTVPGPQDVFQKNAPTRISLSDLPKDKQEEIYDKVMDARMAGQTDAAGNLKSGFMFDASGNIISTGNDGRDTEAERLALLAQATNPNQSTTPTEETPATDPAFFRLLADGGMPEDAPVGGIMDLESGRQMYFLGKLVKKATRAVKKIVKSPIGKAAILGGAAYFGGGAGGLKNFFGTGSFNPLRTISTVTGLSKGQPMERAGLSGLGKILNKLGLADFKGGLTKGGMAALIGGGVTSIPLIASLFGIDGDENKDQTIDPSMLGPTIDIAGLLSRPYQASLGQGFVRSAADGGRIGYQEGSKEPVAKKTMPLLDMDGQEMDLRDNGGFVPIGRMEKADDVPARLSKNEFVFTADAVRNAGDGDVDKGAEVMYNMMKNLEDGGDVSDESQGLEGARDMFQTAQRLEEVL